MPQSYPKHQASAEYKLLISCQITLKNINKRGNLADYIQLEEAGSSHYGSRGSQYQPYCPANKNTSATIIICKSCCSLSNCTTNNYAIKLQFQASVSVQKKVSQRTTAWNSYIQQNQSLPTARSKIVFSLRNSQSAQINSSSHQFRSKVVKLKSS